MYLYIGLQPSQDNVHKMCLINDHGQVYILVLHVLQGNNNNTVLSLFLNKSVTGGGG